MNPSTPTSAGRLGRITFVSFLTGFSGAMMPGTLLVAVIAQTSLQGFRAVIGLITGHALLELVLLGLLVLGFQTVLSRARVRGAIGLIGGLALIWMGADMVRNAFGLSLTVDAQADAAYSWPELFFWGAALCVANPYFTGWWATIGAGQLAHASPRSKREFLAFFVGHEAADYTWYSIVGIIIITGKNWLSDGIYQALIIGCGAIIALLGGYFLITGCRLLARGGATAEKNEAQTNAPRVQTGEESATP